MAIWTTKLCGELSDDCVLAPERYDPRRTVFPTRMSQDRGIPLVSLVQPIRRIATAASADTKSCLVLDTSHAREGVIIGPYNIAQGHELGSAKKVLGPGQVIISRLRPYLRQVAFVDKALFTRHSAESFVCSTEFFVLQSVDEDSIAFLVPFLLSSPVQSMLAASQEGGHHPRFTEQTLLNLLVPSPLVETRNVLSHNVESIVKTYREYERNIALMSDASARAYAEFVK